VAEHGTETCYVNRGCRLPECREAHRKARGRRTLLQQRGVLGKVPAARLRPRIDALMAGGWSIGEMERQIRSRHAIDGILAGRPVLRSTAARILALADTSPGGQIPAALTMLRVSSLYALGWPAREIKARAGLRGDTFTLSKPYVWRPTAVGVLTAFGELQDTPGPSKHTAALARAKGYVPPAAWDDPGTLCWPAGSKPFAPPPPRGSGRPVVWDALRVAEVERLRSFGVSDPEIAVRFGVGSEMLRRSMRRARSGRGRYASTPAA
jgi:hypothetical protein